MDGPVGQNSVTVRIMIKFFRRIRQSLLAENKFSKYLFYAIGEIILVVIGILIALQINNWNQNRLLKNKEALLLRELHSEFKMNRDQLDTVLAKHRIAKEACDKLITMFPINLEKQNLDSISKYLVESLYSWTFNPSQGVVKSITNTSSFEVISNDELRKLIVSWEDLVVDYQEDEISARTMVQTSMDEFLMKNFDYDFNFDDKRNNISALTSREFEYVMKTRRGYLQDILGDYNNLDELEYHIVKIIELTATKNDD